MIRNKFNYILLFSLILVVISILLISYCSKPVTPSEEPATTVTTATSTTFATTTTTVTTTVTTTTVTTTTTTTTTTTVTTTTTTTTSTTTTGYYEVMLDINANTGIWIMGDGTYGPNCAMSFDYNFKMSKYEVTNAWYAQAIADGLYSNSTYWTTNGWTWKVGTANPSDKPSYWTDANYNGTDQPVVGVSWYEAVAFCNWLSIKKGKTPVYQSSGSISAVTANGYRLPTDVEWEYACAKGTSGASERIYAWGDTWDSTKAVYNNTKSANVGSKPSGNTPEGLCDMSGNVLEWCSDTYQTNPVSGPNRYYFVSDTTDQSFVLHSGAWFSNLEGNFRGSIRYNFILGNRYYHVGFRIVLP